MKEGYMKKIIVSSLCCILLTACSTPNEISNESQNNTSKTVDTSAPVITFVEEPYVMKVGEAFDVEKVIASVEDDVDGVLPIAIEGKENEACYTVSYDVNPEVAGSYTVDVTAIDNAGNESSKQLSVIVEE